MSSWRAGALWEQAGDEVKVADLAVWAEGQARWCCGQGVFRLAGFGTVRGLGVLQEGARGLELFGVVRSP